MSWQKLTEAKGVAVCRGARLRFPAGHPYESTVELMVVEPPGIRTLGLMVDTGYKAGLLLIEVPEEGLVPGLRAISSDWLISNWRRWVYAETPASKVMIDLQGRKVPPPRAPASKRRPPR